MLDPAAPFAVLLTVLGAGRRPHPERGASAVEWTIIATVAAGLLIAAVAIVLGLMD
jgi:hypothetical protein